MNNYAANILTKEFYEREFLPVYNLQLCKPKIFIDFETVLPFHIPMRIGKAFTLSSEQGYFSFIFDMVTTSEAYKYGADEKLLRIHKSKIHMIAAVDLDYEEFLKDPGQYHNIYFDLLLEDLNKIVLSYLVAMKDDDCHYLTKEMLPALTVVSVTNLQTWENHKAIFLLHAYLPIEKEPLTEANEHEILRMQGVIFGELNPFADGEQFIRGARRYFKQGFFLEALNMAQTSVEVLVRTLFAELLRDEGKSPQEIEETLEDTSFMTIIKKQLPKYLGGCWDVAKSNTIAGKWYDTAYMLRNRAVHRGRIPNLPQADEAMLNTEEFRNYIVARLKANKKKYPKLNEYLS